MNKRKMLIAYIQQEIVNKVDDSITVKDGKNFLAFHDTHEIYIGKDLSMEGVFTNVIQKKGFRSNHKLLYAILHEIGHLQTLSRFTLNDVLNYHVALTKIKEDTEEKEYAVYLGLEIEKVAHEWAVNYYKENENEMKEIEKALNDLM